MSTASTPATSSHTRHAGGRGQAGVRRQDPLHGAARSAPISATTRESVGLELTIGYVEGRPAAIVVSDPREPRSTPSYFILLDWQGGQALAIRDFRYARYAVEDAEIDVIE